MFNNVDYTEITKFEAIASQYWNVKGKFKSLHRINPLRLDYIIERSNGLFGKKVLDIGCGGGLLAESMAKEGAIVTGLDISFELLQIARVHAIESKIRIDYFYETTEKHVIKHENEYDVITCMEMLEHVPNPQSIVRTCAKLVKSGGQVFFSTINRNIKSWIMAIFGAEYILNMVPKGTHDIRKFIKPSELMHWMDQEELEAKHIIGLHYNPLTDKFMLKPGIDVNYLLHATAISK